MLRPPLPGVGEIDDPADDADELDDDATLMPVDPASGIMTAPADAADEPDPRQMPDEPPLAR